MFSIILPNNVKELLRFVIILLFIGSTLIEIQAQRSVKLEPNFINGRNSLWGVDEIDINTTQYSGIPIKLYYLNATKDKKREIKYHFLLKENQVIQAKQPLKLLERYKIAIGFSGVGYNDYSFTKFYNKDENGALSNLFEDMALHGTTKVWKGKDIQDLMLYVFTMPDIELLGVKGKSSNPKFLYLLHNIKPGNELSTGLGAPVDSVPLIQNSIPVSFIDPAKSDLRNKARSILTDDLGFNFDEDKLPSLSHDGKTLWIDSCSIDMEQNQYFDIFATVGNVPVYKSQFIDKKWLTSDIFDQKKEYQIPIANLDIPEYKSISKAFKVLEAPYDSILKSTLNDLFKKASIRLNTEACRFNLDSTFNGLYVTGLSNKLYNPAYLYIPLNMSTVFIDFKTSLSVSEKERSNLLGSVELYSHGLPVNLDVNTLEFQLPLFLVNHSEFTVKLKEPYSSNYKLELSKKNKTNIIITATSTSEAPKNTVAITPKEETSTEVDEDQVTTVFYLDIAELNNKRLLQYFLQAQLDSLKKEDKNYIVFLSNGSNPITDTSNKGDYMNIIKKISFLYPETASPRSDKTKLVETLIRENLPTTKLNCYFFLSPVSYNRFKEYMINEINAQYNTDLTIIVENLESQKIDQAYNHIQLIDKK